MDVGSWRGNKVQGINKCWPNDYCICGTFGGDFNLVVILIWQFGGFSSDHQIKITANTVVLSQVLINSNDEQAYPPN